MNEIPNYPRDLLIIDQEGKQFRVDDCLTKIFPLQKESKYILYLLYQVDGKNTFYFAAGNFFLDPKSVEDIAKDEMVISLLLNSAEKNLKRPPLYGVMQYAALYDIKQKMKVLETHLEDHYVRPEEHAFFELYLNPKIDSLES